MSADPSPTEHRRRLVPPRPARARPADVPRRRGGAAPRRSRCSCSTRRCSTRPGGPRRTVLYRCLRALDESLGGRLLVVRGDPADVVPRVAAAVDAPQVHVAADFGPYGRARDEAVEKALAERRPRAGAHRLALRRRARAGHQARRHAVQGVHPVPPRLAAARLAPARRHRRRHRRLARPRRQARRPAPGARSRTTTGSTRSCRRPARTPRRELWREFVDDGRGGYKRGPGPSRQARARRGCRCTSSTAPCTRARCWPTWPGRSGDGAETVRSRAGVARVLRRRAVAPPRLRARELRPPVRPPALGHRARGRRALRGVGARGAPASRSSTPGCASSARRPGCTTGSA